MVLINFYEAEAEAEANIHVEIKLVPHLHRSEEVQTIAFMPIADFERQVTDTLLKYVAQSGAKTRSMPEMCETPYVRNPADDYGDPWKFR